MTRNLLVKSPRSPVLFAWNLDYDREEEEEEKINESNEAQDKLSYDTNFELYLYEQ